MAQTEELMTLGKVVFALSITLVVWAWLAVGLRLWVRLRITKSQGWDDVAMIATLVSCKLQLVEHKLTEAVAIYYILRLHFDNDNTKRSWQAV